MTFHPSLTELTAHARQCATLTEVSGAILEASQLVRNALDHRESAQRITQWYSLIVDDALASPALRQEGISRVRLSGAVVRRCALPRDAVTWLSLGFQEDQLLTDVLARAHCVAHPATDSLVDICDAGARSVGGPGRPTACSELFSLVLAHRPAPLRTIDGLPDPDQLIDVDAHLVRPTTDLARWAGVCAGCTSGATAEMIACAQAGGVLSDDEAESLNQAWMTALELQATRWREGVALHPEPSRNLPALERAAFGAASRSVSLLIAAVQARQAATAPGAGVPTR